MKGMTIIEMPYGAATHFLRKLGETWSYSEYAGFEFDIVFQGKKKFTTFVLFPSDVKNCLLTRSHVFNSPEDLRNEKVVVRFLKRVAKIKWSVKV